MTDAEEMAALKARVAELEARNKPPESFKPGDWQPINPIDRVSMPPSVMQEMAQAVPDHVVRGIVRDNRAPTGRPGVIPSSQQLTHVRPPPGGGTGWREPTPLSNPPGVNYADRLMDEQDRRDRAELAQRLGKR